MSNYLPDMVAPPEPPPAEDANVHIPDNIQDKVEVNQHDQHQTEDEMIQIKVNERKEVNSEVVSSL